MLIIAESPPHYSEGKRPRYFYFDKLTGKEYLFRNMMRALLPDELAIAEKTKNKVPALRLFCDKLNFLLIDACNYPINHLPMKQRTREIEKQLPTLVRRVERLVSKTTPIILIKKNTLKTVQDTLLNKGYFLCSSEPLPFPAYGNQNRFRTEFQDVVSHLDRKTKNLCPI